MQEIKPDLCQCVTLSMVKTLTPFTNYFRLEIRNEILSKKQLEKSIITVKMCEEI